MQTPRRFVPPVWVAWTVLAAALTPANLPGSAALAQRVAAGSDDFPPTLHETGLYAPGSGRRVGTDVMVFSPQYPLWSDGADKQRWMRLPAGGFIDASDADAWVFPPGTRFSKEFGHTGRPVETRVIERRADGTWHFAAYVWNAAAGRSCRRCRSRSTTTSPTPTWRRSTPTCEPSRR